MPKTEEAILPPKTEAVVEEGCVLALVASPWRPPNNFDDPVCAGRC